MTGLRERKKLDCQVRIEEESLKLFDSIGFEAATMKKIANASEVGVGTLYNYYPSKVNILMSIISKRTVPYVDALQKITKEESDIIGETLRACIDIYLESFSFFSKNIWREFVTTALSKGMGLFLVIRSIDEVFIQSLISIIQYTQKNGCYRHEVSADTAAEALYGILIYHIMQFISTEDMTLTQVHKLVLEEWKLIIDDNMKG